MPGICGITYTDIHHAGPALGPLARTLKSRGNADIQEHSYKNINLGSCGTPIHQNKRGTIWCLLDGQLYYTDDLRKALIDQGRAVEKGSSDTELIIDAYEVWGLDFLEKIDGDFAFALLDQNRDELILARDRIGKKPLYWYHHQQQFLFASELKALMTTGIIPQTPSQDSLAAYLFFGFIPQDLTPIAGVNKLLPGHYLRLQLNHNKSIHSFWSYSALFNREATYRRSDEHEQLDLLLKNSLNERLLKFDSGKNGVDTDTNANSCACFLSGGLGSASVAYYLNQAQVPFKPFTVTFSKQTEEDQRAASIVSHYLKLEQEVDKVSIQDLLSNLPKIIWHLDEPLADPNIVITWRLAEMAAKNTRFAFSGMGSDELLAGHNRFLTSDRLPSLSERFSDTFIPMIKHCLFKPVSWFSKSAAFNLLKRYPAHPVQTDYLIKNALINPKAACVAAPAIAKLFDPEIFLHRFYNIDRLGTSVDATLYLDIKTRLADQFILQYDRLTACHGLNWQSPFLDKKIIEFLAPLPRGGYQRERGGSLLKFLFSNRYPKPIIDRSKQSRPQLLVEWFESKEIREVYKRLCRGVLVENGLISARWLENLLNNPRKSACNNPFLCCWSILCLEVWFRLFIDQPVRQVPPEMSTIELLK